MTTKNSSGFIVIILTLVVLFILGINVLTYTVNHPHKVETVKTDEQYEIISDDDWNEIMTGVVANEIRNCEDREELEYFYSVWGDEWRVYEEQ